MISSTIVERYHLERASAETGDDKRRVWRTYARAVIEEFQRPERLHHELGAPVIIWRRASGDEESWSCPCGRTRERQGAQPPSDRLCQRCREPLTEYTPGIPVRNPAYWATIPLHDLQELWLALERARHKASDDDEA